MWLWSVVIGTEVVRIYRAMQHNSAVNPSEVSTGFAERVEQQVCGEFTNAPSLRKSQYANKTRHLLWTKEKAR